MHFSITHFNILYISTYISPKYLKIGISEICCGCIYSEEAERCGSYRTVEANVINTFSKEFERRISHVCRQDGIFYKLS
jgi:hypothetical protein